MADDAIDLTEVSSCPMLGLPFDRRTHYTFPDPAHRCFAEKRLATADPARQATNCLTSRFPECERFRGSQHPDAVAYRSSVAASVEPLVASSTIPTTAPDMAGPTSVASTVPDAAPADFAPRRRSRRDAEPPVATADISPPRPTWREVEPEAVTEVVSPRRRLWRDAAVILMVIILGAFVYSLVVSPGRSPAGGTVVAAPPTASPLSTPPVVASPSPTPTAFARQPPRRRRSPARRPRPSRPRHRALRRLPDGAASTPTPSRRSGRLRGRRLSRPRHRPRSDPDPALRSHRSWSPRPRHLVSGARVYSAHRRTPARRTPRGKSAHGAWARREAIRAGSHIPHDAIRPVSRDQPPEIETPGPGRPGPGVRASRGQPSVTARATACGGPVPGPASGRDAGEEAGQGQQDEQVLLDDPPACHPLRRLAAGSRAACSWPPRPSRSATGSATARRWQLALASASATGSAAASRSAVVRGRARRARRRRRRGR